MEPEELSFFVGYVLSLHWALGEFRKVGDDHRRDMYAELAARYASAAANAWHWIERGGV